MKILMGTLLILSTTFLLWAHHQPKRSETPPSPQTVPVPNTAVSSLETPAGPASLSSPLPTSASTGADDTNGAGLPQDVQLLIRDLEVNLDQLLPLLALAKGGNATNGGFNGGPSTPAGGPANYGQNFSTQLASNLSANLGQNVSTPPAAPPGAAAPSPPNTALTGTNRLVLLNDLGATLEDMQSDIQELLPRLADFAGLTNPNTGNSSGSGGNPNAPAGSAAGAIPPASPTGLRLVPGPPPKP